jgi:hemerythrin-like domain-containing protein
MCFVHNLFFRNLNAIWLQYEQVSKPKDVADFMVFCQCVHEGIHTHHHHEEEYFFPDVEAYTGVKGLMETNIEQHKAFEKGLTRFGEYVYSVKPEEYDPKAFKEILDSFTPALVRHLNDEIPTLMALEKYGADKLMKAWKDLEKRILAGALDPVFLLRWSSKWRCANEVVSCHSGPPWSIRQEF